MACATGLGVPPSLGAASGEPIEIRASRSGFRPASLVLRVGEPVRLILRTDDGEHCFAVDAFRVEKRIMPGRATELELVPDRTGRFPFYCCLETAAAAARERGEIVVTE